MPKMVNNSGVVVGVSSEKVESLTAQGFKLYKTGEKVTKAEVKTEAKETTKPKPKKAKKKSK